jgi:hypothetical protein
MAKKPDVVHDGSEFPKDILTNINLRWVFTPWLNLALKGKYVAGYLLAHKPSYPS